jgi:hypothetical protein
MRELAPFSLNDFATAPFRWERSAVIAATPEAVFAEFGDPSLWFALMHRSVWKTAATSGVGAIREVQLRIFGRFRVEFLAWNEPVNGRGDVAFTMTEVDSPLVDQMGEQLRVAPHEQGAEFTYRVVAAPSRLGRPIQPVLRGILRGLFARSVGGLAKRTAWSAGQVRATQDA